MHEGLKRASTLIALAEGRHSSPTVEEPSFSDLIAERERAADMLISDMIASDVNVTAAAAILGKTGGVGFEFPIENPERIATTTVVYAHVRDHLGGQRVKDVYLALSRGDVPPDLIKKFIDVGCIVNPDLLKAIQTGYPSLSKLAGEIWDKAIARERAATEAHLLRLSKL